MKMNDETAVPGSYLQMTCYNVYNVTYIQPWFPNVGTLSKSLKQYILYIIIYQDR